MPLIHHPELGLEREVSEKAADIFTTNPSKPWRRGPLPRQPKPTAIEPSPQGDSTPFPTEED